MKKKVLSLLLVGAMTTSMLAGCGSSKTDEATNTENNTSETEVAEAENTDVKNPVTIKTVSMFGGTDPNAVVYEAIIEEFMKEYDYITVEDNSQSSDEDWKASVAADFAVGNEPDVIK